MQTLSPSLYRLDLGVANVYLIRSKSAAVLVDAGVRRSPPQIERGLKRLGLGWTDLTHIFITHAHPDHVGNFAEIARLSGAEVWAHRLELPVLRGERPVAMANPAGLRAVDRLLGSGIRTLMPGTQATGKAERALEADAHLSHILPGLRTVHLPGHSPGQLGFYHQAEGWLVGGDVMMNLFGLTFPMAAFTPDVPAAWRSILTVARIQPKILALGHGAPHRNPDEALRHMAARAKKALERPRGKR
ncbi:MAG: MBL fold metallo-hydrolase [Meiothermus sp.]|nr:MBL fold metallo-hydrolase [Meiothermus sp.]